ncbi:DedA family protein [Microbacterium trichothecenolyticum]|uniref:Inner membrane protein YabI n=1 Tax=Microbacterium trichothecenolyticum TaxID=69370 RepID=A0A0M2H7A6_MICTR|nr:DedA family protein [Microbacterium trichothecenolyticum]KJL39819.1 Inner membrane protein YabI [Microbacterium trichothecenolyticum]
MNEFLTWLLDAVQSVDPIVRTLLAGFAIMLETSVLIGLVVPGDTVVIVAATAVSSVLEGVILGIAVVIGAVIGESIGFWLGRYLGPRIQHSKLGRRIGEENWARSERYLRRRGGPAIFISRFLPVLHSLVPLTVGMSGYPYRRFLAWTIPACVIWSTLYISVAAVAAGTYRELADRLHYAGYIFVGVIVLFLVLVFVSKKVIERAERKHLEQDGPDESPVADVKD